MIAMVSFQEWLAGLPLQRTKDGTGKGVTVTLRFVVYADGHGNILYGTPAVNQPVDSTRDALAALERVWELAQAQARSARESAAEDDKKGLTD
jgi:uncharacterized Ntn-hydrolase superfamily protein